jgi:hypothetical protein
MGRLSTLVASLATTLCMAGLFVTVALAAGPPAGRHGAPHGTGGSAELCFLRRLVP